MFEEVWRTTRTVGHIIRRNSRMYLDKTVFIDKDRRLTYKEFNEEINKVANALLEHGIENGDRIALLSLNSIEYMEILYAAGKIGAAIIPLNTRFSPSEIKYVIEDSTPKILFVGIEHLDIINKVIGELKSIDTYIIFDNSPRDTKYTEYKEFISNNVSEPSEVVYDDNTLIIMYSSGTTGKPKGCMLTHENIFEANVAFKYEWKFSQEDNMIAVMPLFHIAALGLVFGMIQAGGTVTILSRFNPEELSKVIEEESATILGLLPTAARFWFSHPSFQKHKYNTLRMFITYGSDVILKAKDLFPHAEVTEYYGCTECTGMISLNNHTEANYKKVKSCGRNAINVNVKIVDEQGNPVPAGVVGEIIARGPTIMKEYWNMKRETEEILRGGWFHTGDLGYMDEEGYIYIVDRLKDMIRSGGENIYSKEVESVILLHPAVKEVAVIGIPDPVWGESVKAYIVPKEGMKATGEEIIKHVKEHLASYKKPKYIEFIDSLPKTSSGRVMKYVLRERERRKEK